MTSLHTCVDEGAIVGMALELPDDPVEYEWRGRARSVGCNRLKCLECGEAVRSAPHLFLSTDRFPPEQRWTQAAALYATPDLALFPGVAPSDSWRLYACRCYYQAESGFLKAFDRQFRDATGAPMRSLPWSCAGHPPAELPRTVDGHTFSRDGLEGQIVDALAQNSATVLHLAHLVADGPDGSAVAAALAGALRDETAAPPLLARLAADPVLPAEAIADAVAQHPALYTPSLLSKAAAAIAHLVRARRAEPARWVEWLQQQALGAAGPVPVVPLLADISPDWLVANAGALATHSPGDAGLVAAYAGRVLVRPGVDEEKIRTLARAIAVAPGVSASVVRAGLVEVLGESVVDVPDGWPSWLLSEIPPATARGQAGVQ